MIKSSLQHLLCKTVLLLTAFFGLCSSCNPPQPTPNPITTGVLVLNQGNFQLNNSTITFYDLATGLITDDAFRVTNGRGLGDTGNDLKIYGSKLYCVVNNSHRVEVMDAKSLQSIMAISLSGKSPRSIAFHEGKAYVSCFDGDVVRIDTATLTVDGTVRCGENPEGICVCNNKIYVANSGGLNYPNYDSTVTVIDINSFSVVKTIPVAINPCLVIPYNDRYVFVQSRGNYGNIPYNLHKIDTYSDNIVKTYNINVLGMAIHQHTAYIYSYDYDSGDSWIRTMDLLTDKLSTENFITDGTVLQTPFCIATNPITGDIYISDAYNYTVTGDVYCFSAQGKKKFSFPVDINPGSIVFKQE
ncbi:MAG: hypothetical protein IK013_05740 [Bacteroidales bacterium]|nr:hypothetical protein [Bacteroidales bacterium]